MARGSQATTGPPQLRRSPRKHQASKKAKVAAEPDIGQIVWSADNGALIWALLAQIQVKDNRLVLFGKNPGTTEVISARIRDFN